MTSISPALTTKNGTSVWPPSIKTSPRVMGRVTPWEAIRAICAEVRVGNRSAASAALESGVDQVGGADMSRAFDSPCEGDVDTPDVAIHSHAIGLELILRRATQHRSGADVELRAVP